MQYSQSYFCTGLTLTHPELRALPPAKHFSAAFLRHVVNSFKQIRRAASSKPTSSPLLLLFGGIANLRLLSLVPFGHARLGRCIPIKSFLQCLLDLQPNIGSFRLSPKTKSQPLYVLPQELRVESLWIPYNFKIIFRHQIVSVLDEIPQLQSMAVPKVGNDYSDCP